MVTTERLELIKTEVTAALGETNTMLMWVGLGLLLAAVIAIILAGAWLLMGGF